ncbi:MAG: hypothetical protein A2Z99_13435 [Treponema sp. GWB1_62_6]|nr:MAG: hypothetical protein A2001_19695 [Treponema sp. GWC1_61_84]OHE70013.1 MAG: hypothetical protein A2Z99_13435 [Treponema sp. GWB1_62_6]
MAVSGFGLVPARDGLLNLEALTPTPIPTPTPTLNPQTRLALFLAMVYISVSVGSLGVVPGYRKPRGF